MIGATTNDRMNASHESRGTDDRCVFVLEKKTDEALIIAAYHIMIDAPSW
jgi:hypothetical protein